MAKGIAQLLLEAMFVGLVLVALGYIVGFITRPLLEVRQPAICDHWNDKYIMEINLFLVGFIAHLLFEFAGANQWYCKHGYACTK
jgi:hypothetical protein